MQTDWTNGEVAHVILHFHTTSNVMLTSTLPRRRSSSSDARCHKWFTDEWSTTLFRFDILLLLPSVAR